MSWWKKIKQLISGTPDLDLSDLKTTGDRGYSAINVQKINKALDSIPPIRRAVILANIIEESGADPHVKGDIDGNSTGLLQWRPERLDPESPHLKDLKSQLKYITTTLASPKNIDDAWTHGGAGSGFKSWKDAQHQFYNPESSLEEVNKAFVRGYVRPKGKNKTADNRLKVARQLLSKMTDNGNN